MKLLNSVVNESCVKEVLNVSCSNLIWPHVHQQMGVRVRVQCRQIQIPKVGADRNEEIIPANRLTQTTCNDYTHLH